MTSADSYPMNEFPITLVYTSDSFDYVEFEIVTDTANIESMWLVECEYIDPHTEIIRYRNKLKSMDKIPDPSRHKPPLHWKAWRSRR